MFGFFRKRPNQNVKRRPVTVRPTLEHLETRLVPAQMDWIGGTSSLASLAANWTNDANASDHHVPGQSDSAYFDKNKATRTIEFDSGNGNGNSYSIGGFTLINGYTDTMKIDSGISVENVGTLTETADADQWNVQMVDTTSSFKFNSTARVTPTSTLRNCDIFGAEGTVIIDGKATVVVDTNTTSAGYNTYSDWKVQGSECWLDFGTSTTNATATMTFGLAGSSAHPASLFCAGTDATNSGMNFYNSSNNSETFIKEASTGGNYTNGNAEFKITGGDVTYDGGGNNNTNDYDYIDMATYINASTSGSFAANDKNTLVYGGQKCIYFQGTSTDTSASYSLKMNSGGINLEEGGNIGSNLAIGVSGGVIDVLDTSTCALGGKTTAPCDVVMTGGSIEFWNSTTGGTHYYGKLTILGNLNMSGGATYYCNINSGSNGTCDYILVGGNFTPSNANMVFQKLDTGASTNGDSWLGFQVQGTDSLWSSGGGSVSDPGMTGYSWHDNSTTKKTWETFP
jgi:hypothetical protein